MKKQVRLTKKEECQEIEKWYKYIKTSVIDMFKQDKCVHPHALIFGYNDKIANAVKQDPKFDKDGSCLGFMHIDLDRFMINDAGKDMASEMIIKIVKECDALAYAFLSEAWAAKCEPDEARDKDGNFIRPSELPDDKRTEIVMVHFESKSDMQMDTYEIVKTDAEPWLYKMEDMSWKYSERDKDKKGEVGGRFAGLLMDGGLRGEFPEDLVAKHSFDGVSRNMRKQSSEVNIADLPQDLLDELAERGIDPNDIIDKIIKQLQNQKRKNDGRAT